MLYFDTSYIVRLHTQDRGWETVRQLAETDNLACCIHGHAEAAAAFHRKFREGAVNQRELRTVIAEFERDCEAGAVRWLPLSPAVIESGIEGFRNLPATVHLRAADAVHLACAAQNGFKEIYSNDRRLLDAAAHFGLSGMNPI